MQPEQCHSQPLGTQNEGSCVTVTPDTLTAPPSGLRRGVHAATEATLGLSPESGGSRAKRRTPPKDKHRKTWSLQQQRKHYETDACPLLRAEY